jgi:Peptidase_C39 like family
MTAAEAESAWCEDYDCEDQEWETRQEQTQTRGQGRAGSDQSTTPMAPRANADRESFLPEQPAISDDEVQRWAKGPDGEAEAIRAAVQGTVAKLAEGRIAGAIADAQQEAPAVRGAVASSTLQAAEGARLLAVLAAVQKIGGLMQSGEAALKEGNKKDALHSCRGGREQLDSSVGAGVLTATETAPIRKRLSAVIAVAAPDAALETPTMCQYTAGGASPASYCGMTALRMLLRYEGLADPGADKVAVLGLDVNGEEVESAYLNGEASGSGMAATGRALGLEGAQFTATGKQDQIVRSLDAGQPVCVAGKGQEVGVFVGDGSHYGTKAERAAAAEEGKGPTITHKDGDTFDESWGGHYQVVVGYEGRTGKPKKGVPMGAKGLVTHYILNDPATGGRIKVGREQFLSFYGPDEAIYVMTYVSGKQPVAKKPGEGAKAKNKP